MGVWKLVSYGSTSLSEYEPVSIGICTRFIPKKTQKRNKKDGILHFGKRKGHTECTIRTWTSRGTRRSWADFFKTLSRSIFRRCLFRVDGFSICGYIDWNPTDEQGHLWVGVQCESYTAMKRTHDRSNSKARRADDPHSLPLAWETFYIAHVDIPVLTAIRHAGHGFLKTQAQVFEV